MATKKLLIILLFLIFVSQPLVSYATPVTNNPVESTETTTNDNDSVSQGVFQDNVNSTSRTTTFTEFEQTQLQFLAYIAGSLIFIVLIILLGYSYKFFNMFF